MTEDPKNDTLLLYKTAHRVYLLNGAANNMYVTYKGGGGGVLPPPSSACGPFQILITVWDSSMLDFIY